MSVPNMEVAAQANQAQQESAKELSFRALESKFQRQLEAERQGRLEAEKRAEEAVARKQQYVQDDDDDDEPYVDKRKLKKHLEQFGQQTMQSTQTEIQKAVQHALEQERESNWLNANKDFEEVMQHADRFAQASPDLANTILKMPKGFERNKLVYHNIKNMRLHEPEKQGPSIQDQIEANKRSPYYQSGGVPNGPVQLGGDFSPSGMKSAYDKMQALKGKIRF